MSKIKALYKLSQSHLRSGNLKMPLGFQAKHHAFHTESFAPLSKDAGFKGASPKSVIHKMSLLTKLVLGLGILIPSVAIAQASGDGKQEGMQVKYSTFESSATKLGFDSAAKQEALLKIFYYAGYLNPHSLWTDLNSIEGIKNHAQEAFEIIYPALVGAHADQRDAKQFHPETLRTKLFDGLSEQESADLLLYLAQHAFNRKLGQERNELTSQNWMTEHKVEYIEAAKILGLIDRIEPAHKEYHAGWNAGASRIGVLTRVIDYFNTISSKNIAIKGETSVLAGGRELWAEIDGITPEILKKLMDVAKSKVDIDRVDISLPSGNNEARTEEGKKYVVELAGRNNIALNPTMPLIKYATKAECPAGREPGRWYPNYAAGEGRKLTESLMSQDVLKTIAADKDVKIVDTAASTDGERPDTITTAADAAQKVVAKIKAGEYGDQKTFFVLFESNQPYIERQTLATQAAVDEVLVKHGLKAEGYTIIVDGVGFRNKQDVATVHSELGALVTERMKVAFAEGLIHEHDLRHLLFQTRDCSRSVPDYPDVEKWHPVHAELGGQDGVVAE